MSLQEFGEKWIDVDTDQQIVTAYVGLTPIFATIVSTGRYGPSKTVKGEYRIWAKVAAIAMSSSSQSVSAPPCAEWSAPCVSATCSVVASAPPSTTCS